MASRKMVQYNDFNLNILLFCCYKRVAIEGKMDLGMVKRIESKGDKMTTMRLFSRSIKCLYFLS